MAVQERSIASPKRQSSQQPQKQRPAPARASPFQGLRTFGLYAAVLAVLYTGWQLKGERHLTAESGLGYALGIVGGVLMLLLLFYPLRKRLRFMRQWGRVAHWFRVHMILGVAGPVLILFHSNFSLGSTNSNVALATMLLVAGSGLVGRYLYSKIHHGLYGRRATLEELRSDAQAQKLMLGLKLGEMPWIDDLLKTFEAEVTSPRRGIWHSVWRIFSLSVKTRRALRSLRRSLKPALREEARRTGRKRKELAKYGKAICGYVDLYLRAVRRTATFALYERLFALWHVLHLPFFVLLVLAAIAHVIAVHLY